MKTTASEIPSWLVMRMVFAALIGVLLRVILSRLPGHDVDMGCFMAWSADIYERGTAHFFREGYFCDYPPFYLYVLWLVGWVRSFFPGEVASLLIKLPPIAADIILGLLLWKACRGVFTEKARFLIFCAIMLYPPLLLNSAVWGQVDSVTGVLCLACALHLRGGRLLLAGALFGAAMAMKPQAFSTAGMFVPAFVVAWSRGRLGRIPGAVALAILVFVLLAMPFADGRGIVPVFERYIAMYETYTISSFNAPNFLCSIGGNLKSEESVVAGISLAVWAKLFLGLSLGAGFAVALRGRRGQMPEPLLLGAYCSMSFFFFGPRMHERYSFLALIFLLGAWLVSRDRRLLIAHLLLTVTFVLNVGQVYLMSLERKYHIPSNDVLLLTLSWINWMPLLLIGLVLFFPNSRQNCAQNVLLRERIRLEPWMIRERRIEALCVSVLLVASGTLFLWRLGSIKAPVTEWVAADYPVVILDLGRDVELASVMVFAGPVHNGSIIIETSSNGRIFEHNMIIDQPSVFNWHERPLNSVARFVRVRTRVPQTRIMEIVFRDKLGRIVPVASVEPPLARAIADEPNTAPDHPSSFNSTFFDEIYFVRTAYEHLYELPIYENTHPPLGKVVISAGIAVLGLNPFGWRLPCALMGMLSGVLSFFLARTIFRSNAAGLLTGLMFGLDGLLISQSRIATVDAMITSFTLAAFCFGWWFSQTHLRDGWYRSWWKLMLAWCFLGCAGATKWNGFFSAPALLLVCLKPWISRLLFRKKEAEDSWKKNLLHAAIVPACGLIMVCVVYFGSYVFVLSKEQSRDWNWVLAQPHHIFSYHSGGILEHPYSSTWWSWPLMLKSLWQHTDKLQETGLSAERVSLGNPLLYWMAFPSFLCFCFFAFVRFFKKKELDFLLILAILLSCVLPWILVKRSTFIYHFLPMLPFYVMTITALVWVASKEMILKKTALGLGSLVLAISLLGVSLFYPLQAGITTDSSYRRAMMWLNIYNNQDANKKSGWFGWVWNN